MSSMDHRTSSMVASQLLDRYTALTDLARASEPAGGQARLQRAAPDAGPWSFRPAWRLKLPMRTPYPSGPKKQQNLWWFLYPPTPNHPKFAISMNFYKWFLKISWNPVKFSSKSVRKTTNLSQKSWKNHYVQILMKNLEKKDEISLNFCVWSGAKELTSCRSRKMLKNAPTLAIWGVDTAENEPSKVSMK